MCWNTGLWGDKFSTRYVCLTCETLAINVAEADVAIAVMIFLNRACNDAASAFLEAGRVWNDKAVIGTNAIGTPIHNKRFGNITLSIEDVVFNCVSINKETDIVYSYNGTVYKIDDNGEKIALKYLGYDKTRNTLRYQYKKQVISIDVEYDERIFTPIARDSDKWKKIYNKRTSLERINGRLDRDLNLENNKCRGLKKTTVMVDIMMLAMMSMAKGHIINKKEENIRKLKTI